MSPNWLTKIFNNTKDFIWNHTHKDPAKVLITLAAFGFALSSMGQCFAININNKIDRKKKKFLLAQETADGAVNIALFLGITSSIWKISDKLISPLGIKQKNNKCVIKNNIDKKNCIKNGGRLFTTVVASVIACNIITPLVRNLIAGKIREKFDEKELSKTQISKINYSFINSPFKNFNEWSTCSVQNKTTPVNFKNKNVIYPPKYTNTLKI